VDEQQIID